MSFEILTGDCRELMAAMEAESIDAIVTDPPYGDTSLDWDRRVDGWLEQTARVLKGNGSVWCFGSMRFWMEHGHSAFTAAGFTYAQEIVWEKHNGSGFHADRFRRVHEIAVQWYRWRWADTYKAPVFTQDATARTARRKGRPAHTGSIDSTRYLSEDGGPRLQRSVIYAPSAHGYAIHPTQKPAEILRPLIEYSCPPGGLVIDPFAGSGSTGVAAAQCGRSFVGIEVDPEMAQAARERLSQGSLLAGGTS